MHPALTRPWFAGPPNQIASRFRARHLQKSWIFALSLSLPIGLRLHVSVALCVSCPVLANKAVLEADTLLAFLACRGASALSSLCNWSTPCPWMFPTIGCRGCWASTLLSQPFPGFGWTQRARPMLHAAFYFPPLSHVLVVVRGNT